MFSWLKNMFGAKAGPKPGSAEYARKLLNQSWEAYKLARRDRPREHYQPYGYSGDAAILGSHDLMHRRTRDLARNAAQAKRITQALVDLIVGTGIQTFSWPFAPSEMLEIATELESLTIGELGPRLTYALESDDLFEIWSTDARQFDVEGRLTWPEMQRMMLSESVLVGNGLLIRVIPAEYELVPLAYQLIEREQLDYSMDRPAGEGTNKIVGGIEFDQANRAVAYHIFVDHPHDFFATMGHGVLGVGAPVATGMRRARIPAERVIDLALFHRPSASLGVSWLDASGQAIWDRDSYMDSEIRTAAVESVFALVAHLEEAEKHGGLGFADDTEDSDEHGNRSYKVGHSSIAATMGINEKLEFIKPGRPNKDAAPFITLLDRDIAAAAGISYYSLTGNYAGTNFSSARAAKLDEDLHVAPLQQWFASRVALRIRREFNALAAAAGLFKSLSPAEFLANQRTYQRFDAIGNGRELLDPRGEGEARTTRLRTGMSTFREECAKEGKHWIRQLMQIAIERKVADLFGVELDFGKGASQPAPAAETKEESRDEADAKETAESSST